jgi:hypothetical protein
VLLPPTVSPWEVSYLYAFMTGLATQEDTLQALFVEVRNLERRHASKRRSRTVAHHLQPLVAFVERYASAVDAAVQGSLNPASLIWGLLRALLVVGSSSAVVLLIINLDHWHRLLKLTLATSTELY